MNKNEIILQIPTNKNEVWKECSQINEWDCTRDAFISSLGRLYLRANRDKCFTLKDTFSTRAGYYVINIEAKSFYIHRLVGETFIDNPYKYNVLNHIDEVKTNNSVNNLEWCTHEYNSQYTHNKKVAQYDLTGKLINTFDSVITASRNNRINPSQLSKSCRDTNSTAGGFIWRYYKDIPKSNIELPVFNTFKTISSYNLEGIKIKTYSSLTDASNDLNIPIGRISDVARKVSIQVNNLLFEYGDSDKIPIRIDNRISKIVQYDKNYKFIKIHASVKDACASLNNNGFQNISACCRHKIKTAYNYKWEYYKEGMEDYEYYNDYINNLNRL